MHSSRATMLCSGVRSIRIATQIYGRMTCCVHFPESACQRTATVLVCPFVNATKSIHVAIVVNISCFSQHSAYDSHSRNTGARLASVSPRSTCCTSMTERTNPQTCYLSFILLAARAHAQRLILSRQSATAISANFIVLGIRTYHSPQVTAKKKMQCAFQPANSALAFTQSPLKNGPS